MTGISIMCNRLSIAHRRQFAVPAIKQLDRTEHASSEDEYGVHDES